MLPPYAEMARERKRTEIEKRIVKKRRQKCVSVIILFTQLMFLTN